jgi:hypothetical protein
MEIKRGNTLSFLINIPEMIVTEIKCQVRDLNNNLIDNLILTKKSETQYLAQSADTSEYPLGQVYYDVKIQSGSIVVSSETKMINIIKEVTI